VPPSEKRTEYGISMWGAPGSGKTTFLAALNIALTRWGRDWKVIGADEASTQKLISLTTSLTRDHAFPLATAGIDDFRWLLVGKVPRSRPKLFRSEQYMETVKIALDLADPSGEISSPEMAERGQRTDLIDYLVRSRGIVFIFDPIRESEIGDTFDHTFGVLAQLAQQMASSPGFSDGKLPHYVAVCITKFDEIRVFRTAEKLNLLVTDPDDPLDLPRVAPDDARELFARLCDVSQTDNAVMVFNTLEQYFRPDRIKYFVTSAIGFFVDPRKGAYDPDDIQNLLPGPENAPKRLRIRGTVHPINVMEPVLWLGRQLAGVPDE
jgi:hypothetical protein